MAGIPVLGADNTAIYNNPANRASANYYIPNTTGSAVPSGSYGANNIGGQAGIYAQAAQMGFNAVFGAITRPKAANLQASQIEGNAELQYAATEFNIARMLKYEKELKESALLSYLDTLDSAKAFSGTQKAAMSAVGSWYGSTFDAFLEDTLSKTEAEISARSSDVSAISANIRFQADMMKLQNDVQLKLNKANASGIRDSGKASGLMALFGLG